MGFELSGGTAVTGAHEFLGDVLGEFEAGAFFIRQVGDAAVASSFVGYLSGAQFHYPGVGGSEDLRAGDPALTAAPV